MAAASLQPFPADEAGPAIDCSASWVVQALERRGRGVVSTAPIDVGAAVLFEARPLVAVVHFSRALQCCATCLSLRHAEVSTKFLPQPLVCAGCGQACWCSEECRNQSQVAGTHPAQLCFAYKRLGEMFTAAQAERAAAASPPAKDADDSAEEAPSVILDPEALSDARLLFYAYLYRRYRPEEFAKWSLLCSPPEPEELKAIAAAKNSAASSSSSSSGAAAKPSDAAVSAALAESIAEEARIEAIHDIVVACLRYAAESIAAPTPAPSAAAAAVDADPLAFPDVGAAPVAPGTPTSLPSSLFAAPLPVPSLALPRLAKQFTDLHISHPSDDLTSSLALDADLPVTRSFYLKNSCNAFALSAPHDKLGNRQDPRGYAIYSQAAMFNHSCMPNVARFDKLDARDVKYSKTKSAEAPAAAAASSSSSSSSSSSLQAEPMGSPVLAPSPSDCSSSSSFTPLGLELRAMHAIPPYTELTLSYTPLFWDRRERHAHLRTYAFKCRCARCNVEKQWEKAERAKAASGGNEEEEEDEEEEHEHEHDGDEDGEDGQGAHITHTRDQRLRVWRWAFLLVAAHCCAHCCAFVCIVVCRRE